MKILIVDDSVVVRTMLARMLEEHSAFAVVGQVDRAERAIDWLSQNRVDIVLLDIEMPDRDGLAALPDVIAAGRGARIVMVSSSTAQGASVTLQALADGAADAVAKPNVGALGRHFAVDLIERLLRIGSADCSNPSTAAERFKLREVATGSIPIVAIGSSTGGLHALTTFFAAMPLAFDAPILVTQHLPAAFMPFFADQLATMSGRPCSVARDGAVAAEGAVYVAPGDAHLICERRGSKILTRLHSGEVANRSLPSIDPMFASVATAFGSSGIGVVLSGMGRDGAEGAALLAGAGADVIVQDEASSVIWGMPGAVARAGLASLCGPADALARHIVRRGAQ
ncbi:chemotaxis-specific protein-glutamate methyltransferase CheB [Sphingomonas paeninsulae]|uniref:protein-glutamate methylesterase n=1 Tax=Sphingomonas paeninsulae TaxID=2319844 RepID=A0A494TDI6_SPHPE|nr:chemotaxis-specific protein-glutamate methyltransferase CheB [Sphingomonas paeninsulae]AYJ87557.1 chemotaxis-specific protein-glutamate methyltransferase CheB [Sphingomonas paeninsulae]